MQRSFLRLLVVSFYYFFFFCCSVFVVARSSLQDFVLRKLVIIYSEAHLVHLVYLGVCPVLACSVRSSLLFISIVSSRCSFLLLILELAMTLLFILNWVFVLFEPFLCIIHCSSTCGSDWHAMQHVIFHLKKWWKM